MHLPMQETQVQSLGWENPLEEGNGNPFQYSCQENPLDREPWWVTVHGVTKEVGYNFTYLHTHTHTHQESLSIPEAILSPSQPSLLS